VNHPWITSDLAGYSPEPLTSPLAAVSPPKTRRHAAAKWDCALRKHQKVRPDAIAAVSRLWNAIEQDGQNLPEVREG